MNTIGRTTLMDRIRNTIRAFQGKPVGSIQFGIDVKRCDQCEYKSNASIGEHLLVIMGARAAYMDMRGVIDIPSGLEAEGKLVQFVKKTVDRYIQDADYNNFDEYIENALVKEYGVVSPKVLYESYKREWCEARGYYLEDMDEEEGINGECYACFDEWYANEYAQLKGE